MTSNIEVTISLNDLGLEDEDLQAEAQNLLPQLREVDGIETADLVTLVNAPQGTKSVSGFLLGLLKAQVNPANIQNLFKFLSDRFGNKPIKMVVKAPDGRELNIEATRKDFEFLKQQAVDFLNNKSSS